MRAGRLHRADRAGAVRRDGDPHAEMDAAVGSLERCSSSRRATKRRDSAMRRGRRISEDGGRGAARRAVARQGRSQIGCEDRRLRGPEDAADRRRELDRKGRGARGLERWKARHPEAASHLAVDDVLVDSMRGRSSTWTRIRVNLRNVPEAIRPPQETPDPDDDPTREWRTRCDSRSRRSRLTSRPPNRTPNAPSRK